MKTEARKRELDGSPGEKAGLDLGGISSFVNLAGTLKLGTTQCRLRRQGGEHEKECLVSKARSRPGGKRVVTESTGVYWKPVWYALEGHFQLLLANPFQVKSDAGQEDG